MSPEDKTMLYYFNMQTDTEGQYRVGRSDVAALLNCSQPTAVKRLENVVRLGYVEQVKVPFAIGRGHGYKYQYHITKRGLNALMVHYDDAKQLFELLRTVRLSEILKQARKISKPRGKAKKVSDKQLSLFGDK